MSYRIHVLLWPLSLRYSVGVFPLFDSRQSDWNQARTLGRLSRAFLSCTVSACW